MAPRRCVHGPAFFSGTTVNYCQQKWAVLAMQQFTLDFQAGLTERFPRWRDTFVHAVYNSRLGLNGVAAKMDMSPSDLTKRLSGNSDEPRPLRDTDILSIIEATQDYTPVYWLLEKFLKDPDARKQEAIARLPGLVAILEATLEQAGGTKQLRAVGR